MTRRKAGEERNVVAAANCSDKPQKKNRKLCMAAAKQISANASVVVVFQIEGNPGEVTATAFGKWITVALFHSRLTLARDAPW